MIIWRKKNSKITNWRKVNISTLSPNYEVKHLYKCYLYAASISHELLGHQ